MQQLLHFPRQPPTTAITFQHPQPSSTMVSFSTGEAIEVIMAFNPFAPRPDPQSITPLHNDWTTNNSLGPFGSEPIVPTLYSNPGISPHRPTRDEPCIKEGLNAGHGTDRGHRSTRVNMTRSKTQEVSFGPLLGGYGPMTNRVYRRDPHSYSHKSEQNAAAIRA